MLKRGVVEPLLAAMDKFAERNSLVRNAVWLLSNLARPKPQNKDLLVRQAPSRVPARMSVEPHHRHLKALGVLHRGQPHKNNAVMVSAPPPK